MLSIPSKNVCLITAAKYAYHINFVHKALRKAVCLLLQNINYATKLKPTAVLAAKCCR